MRLKRNLARLHIQYSVANRARLFPPFAFFSPSSDRGLFFPWVLTPAGDFPGADISLR